MKKKTVPGILLTLLLMSALSLAFDIQSVKAEPQASRTFGKTTLGSFVNNAPGNYKLGTTFTEPSGGGTITMISMYMRELGGDGTVNVRAAIYTNYSGDAPVDLAAYSDAVSVGDWAWYNFSVSWEFEGENPIWLGVIVEGTVEFYRDDGEPSQLPYNTDTYADGVSDPFGTPSYQAWELSIYAGYEPLGPKTIYVDDDNTERPWDGTPEHPYQNITSGLEHASDGDTIYVRAGTYNESPEIIGKDNITLVGGSRFDTVVNGSLSSTYCDGTIVMNFEIKGTLTFSYPPSMAEGIYVYNNTVRSGVILMADHSTVEKNVIEGGLSLEFSMSISPWYNTIENNTIYDGVDLWGSYHRVEDNVVYGNITTHFHRHSMTAFIHIIDNKLIGGGIILGVGSGWHTVERNSIMNSSFGILEAHGIDFGDGPPSGQNTIVKNHILSCDKGIYFKNDYHEYPWYDPSSYSNVSKNTFYNNTYGIYSKWVDEIKVYHNNFIDNSIQFFADLNSTFNTNNTLDDGYPSGGNYWSDYNGTDLYSGLYQNETGPDGIIDSPYVIDANNTDNYPLVHPYGSVRNLDTGLTYLTIQAAIDANETLDGHTLFVRNGTYHESVIVDKTLSLIGENRESTIIDGSTYTVVSVEANRVVIKGFTIQNGWRGIYFPLAVISDGNNISDNKIININFGISGISSGSIISGNSITANNGTGIDLAGHRVYGDSSNNIISGNSITANNGTGIAIKGMTIYAPCSNNTISENNITSSDFGIELLGSSNNTIFANNIIKNKCGVNLSWASSNKFYHNSFTDNSQQVNIARPSYSNFWNDTYPSGGNYWSDYNGTDVYHGTLQDMPGSDGMGDTPYVIDGNNTDYYPLMGVGSPPSTPTVLSPNGGELWSGTQTINWSASTDPDEDPVTYDIEYSMNGGTNWTTLTTDVSGTSYIWNTTIYPDSNNYLVKVRAYDGLLVSGWAQSDSTFIVDNKAPLVEILYPTEHQVVKAITIWVNGTVTELNKGTLQPSINDTRFSLAEWDGSAFAFMNISIIPEGPVSVTVSFSDLVGNMGSDPVSFSYSIEIIKTELSVSATPSSALVGYEIRIVGRLTLQENGTGIADAPILVSYRYHPDLMSYIPEGEGWNVISTVTTTADGSYSVTWFVMSSGYYVVEVFYPGFDGVQKATNSTNLLMTSLDTYIFSVSSNSTVSALNFNSTARELTLNVSGPSGTGGYMDIFLAKSLVADVNELKIYFDGVEKSYDAISISDIWFIRLTYTHSTHTARVSFGSAPTTPVTTPIPVPLSAILSTILAAIAITLSILKYRTKHTAIQKQRIE